MKILSQPQYALRGTTLKRRLDGDLPEPKKGRKILGTELTASLTTPQTHVSKEASELRISQTVTNFYIDAKMREVMQISMKREPTGSQGSSSSNAFLTPSRHNQARHLDPISTLSCDDARIPLQDLSNRIATLGSITPGTERELRALKFNTPERANIENSPAFLQRFKKPIKIYENTHYGNNKHMTVSGLTVSNEADRMVEYRIRPLWDRLVKKQNDETISAEAMTLEFIEEERLILEKLNHRASQLEEKLLTFFMLEEKIYEFDKNLTGTLEDHIQNLNHLVSIQKEILKDFSTSHEIAFIRERRIDSYWINKIKDPNTYHRYSKFLKKPDISDEASLKEKGVILRAANNLKLELKYQAEAAADACQAGVIENLELVYFGNFSPNRRIHQPLSGKELRERALSILSPVKRGTNVYSTLDTL